MRKGTKKSQPRSRGRPKKFDEAEVLDAITDLFWERGLAGTSLDALSSATGVARPSLYATFGDKDAMYLAGLRNFFARIDAAVSPVVQSEAPVDQILRGIFDVLIDLYTGHDDAARGCLIICTAATEAATHDEVREELSGVLAGIDARFGRVLERAKQRGELGSDVDVQAIAPVLAGVTHTLAVRARAGQGRDALREIAAAAVALVSPR